MTGPMSDDRLIEIRARERRVPPAPWRTEDNDHTLERWILSENGELEVGLGYVGNRTEDLAEFIVHAREDVPDLLAEVERLRTELSTRTDERDEARRAWATTQILKDLAETDRDHFRERLAETDQGAVILALEETVAAGDADRDRLEADRDRLRDERNRRDRKLTEAQAELERLRPELETVRERLTEESAGLTVAWQAAKDHKAEKDRLAGQVQALSLVKVWRNEDGKKFIFVDDLLPILHPGEGAAE